MLNILSDSNVKKIMRGLREDQLSLQFVTICFLTRDESRYIHRGLLRLAKHCNNKIGKFFRKEYCENIRFFLPCSVLKQRNENAEEQMVLFFVVCFVLFCLKSFKSLKLKKFLNTLFFLCFAFVKFFLKLITHPVI